MVVRFAKIPFLLCPGCSTKRELEVDDRGNINIKESTGRRCPHCGAPLVEKKGRFGRFLACSNYPNCTYTEPFPIGTKCPLCGGDVVERTGRSGKVFYACSRYPECNFLSWDEPVEEECPCGSKYLVVKKRGRRRYLQCPQCKKTYSLKSSS